MATAMVTRTMRWAAAAMLAVALLWAPSASATPEAETRAVIENQLEAFQRDDWSDAYAYASPSIQRKFGDPENFGRMVRDGYPMVWRPSDVEFLDSDAAGDRLVHRLRIVDGVGQAFIARYLMQRIDGVWRIAAVSIEEEPAAGA